MWLLYTILILAGAAGVVVLAAAAFARYALRPPGPPVLEVIGPETPLAADAATVLDELERALADQGLRRRGRLRIRSTPNVTAYAAVLASEDGLVIAQGVLHAVRFAQHERVVSRCVELSTRLEGGAVLVTSNAARHALTDQLVSYWRFPLCRDPAALLRIHRAVIAADGRRPEPLSGEASAWVSRLMEDGNQTWRALEDAGLVRRVPGPGKHRKHPGWRYTWRFALTAVVGSVWPISSWRERQDRREARAMLETVWLGALWKTG